MSDVSIELKVFLTATDNKKLQVPPYQRNYSWDHKQLVDLWTDITSLREGPASAKHFMGLIVLISQADCVEIVDGQQRITTLFLLYIAIRDHIHELLRGKESSDILKYHTEYQKTNEIVNYGHDSVLRPNRNDNAVYTEIVKDYVKDEELEARFQEIHGEDEDAHYLNSIDFKRRLFRESGFDFRSLNHNKHWKAYQYFYSQLEELLSEKDTDGNKLTELVILRDLIDSRLRIIQFKSNDQDAFNLFETLNDRGLGLAAVDLIKNHFLRKYDIRGEELEPIADKWDEIFSSRGKIRSNEHNLFLRHLYNSRSPFITKSSLYTSYKNEINSKTTDKARDNYLEELNENSDYYIKFKRLYDVDNAGKVSPLIPDDELFELILLLQKSGSVQWYSIAFPLFKIYHDADNREDTSLIKLVKQVFWLIANTVLRFQILEVRFNYLEKRIPRLARAISHKMKIPIDKDESDLSEIESFDHPEEALKYVSNELNRIIDEVASDSKLEADRNLDQLNEILSDDEKPVKGLFDDAPILKSNLAKDFDSNSIAYGLIRLFSLSEMDSNATIRPLLSLEHVLPQKYVTNWSSSNSYAPRVLYQLGNMIMLKKELNSSASNGTFDSKKKIYDSQNVKDYLGELSIENIESQNDWNEILIWKRTEIIANRLQTILKSREYRNFTEFRLDG